MTLTTVMDRRIVAVPHYRRAGRPAKDRQPDDVTYRSDGALASLPEQYTRKLQQKSGFILATHQLDFQALPDAELLRAYQEQQKVERGFRFLKDPLFMASTLYLKSPKRIHGADEGHDPVLTGLCRPGVPHPASPATARPNLPQSKGQPIRTPTARWVFQFFTGIHRLVIAQGQVLVLNLNEHQHRLLAALGERYVALYSNSG